MEVEANGCTKGLTLIGNVIYGSVVKYENKYWIKSSETGQIVRLKDGWSEVLGTEEQVEVVEAKVIIKN